MTLEVGRGGRPWDPTDEIELVRDLLEAVLPSYDAFRPRAAHSPEWRLCSGDEGREPSSFGRGLFQFLSRPFSHASSGDTGRCPVADSDLVREGAGDTEPGLKELFSMLLSLDRDGWFHPCSSSC